MFSVFFLSHRQLKWQSFANSIKSSQASKYADNPSVSAVLDDSAFCREQMLWFLVACLFNVYFILPVLHLTEVVIKVTAIANMLGLLSHSVIGEKWPGD